jgi:hypothetical protein
MRERKGAPLSTTEQRRAAVGFALVETHLRQLVGQVARVALREAAGHDDAARLTVLLVAGRFKDGGD